MEDQQQWKLVPMEPAEEMLEAGAMRVAMNAQYVATAEAKAEAVCRVARSAASPSAPQPAEGLTEIGWVLVKGADNEYGLEARPYLGTELLELPLGRHPIYIRKAALSAAPQPVAVEPLTDAPLKSLNAMAADLLRPYLKPGQKVIWREAFRWHDDNGVLPNHYDGMELPALAESFNYDWQYDTDFKHAAIVWTKVAASSPQEKERG